MPGFLIRNVSSISILFQLRYAFKIIDFQSFCIINIHWYIPVFIVILLCRMILRDIIYNKFKHGFVWFICSFYIVIRFIDYDYSIVNFFELRWRFLPFRIFRGWWYLFNHRIIVRAQRVSLHGVVLDSSVFDCWRHCYETLYLSGDWYARFLLLPPYSFGVDGNKISVRVRR